MIAIDADTTSLDRLLARLDALDFDAVAAPPTKRALDRLRAYARSIAHVKTGRLRASMTTIGPVAVGGGTLEGRVSPVGTFYAIYEVARGGDHDYAGRTVAEAGDELAALVADLERAISGVLK